MKELFDPTEQLERLKKFQRSTVEYVFNQMFEIESPALRFLVADEVGLGKTMVARGVIAKAIRWLQERKVRRIDIVYICSNAAIAAQNISRLNVLPNKRRAAPVERGQGTDDKDPVSTFPTRLTLLPLHARKLDSNPINFVSFTPGTTFDLKRSGGTAVERSLIWYALREVSSLWQPGLGRLLRGNVKEMHWEWREKQWDGLAKEDKPDVALLKAFRKRVVADKVLRTELIEVCNAFKGVTGRPKEALNSRRFALIGQLRRTLAEACLHALEPDLIVLDEFQRFKTLFDLEKGGDAAELAKSMFEWQADSGPRTRTLLLSATPYKMYTAHGEVEDDHYADFLSTMKFLFDSPDATNALTDELRRYRRALQSLNDCSGETAASQELSSARDALQSRLLGVMVRTERVTATSRRDSMVEERIVHCEVRSADVAQAISLDRVRDAVGASDMIEFWKSAPYLLSFMKGYDVIKRLSKHVRGKDYARRAKAPLLDAIDGAQGCMVHGIQVARHGEIDSANARLRMLTNELSNHTWRLLWIPPSLPYLKPSGRYADVGDVTKSLVFSSWNVVPDVIAALTSYEAERRMFQDHAGAVAYGEVTRTMRGLLRFSVTGEGTEHERFAGMGAMLLGYPSPSLAILGDPLELAIAIGQGVEHQTALSTVAARIGAALESCGLGVSSDESAFDVDPRWYWAALAVLDSHWAPQVGCERQALHNWLTSSSGWREVVRPIDSKSDEHESTGFDKVLDRFAAAFASPLELKGCPADLEQVLATLALGGPAVCALRSLRRQAPEMAWTEFALLQAAARVGEGFRTLFNVPESMALLKADEHYWREAANYGVEGNLQSVLDEHVHTLRESLGLFDASANDLVAALGSELAEPLKLRTSTLSVNNYTTDRAHNQLVDDLSKFTMRTRYGLRFGELRGDKEEVLHRVDLVRKAFNAPFRPFILASTSVGQEGLDFHTWCHRVVHWNLPTNPVDLEQREGRVHRYKGLAVRRNVARRFGLDSLREDGPTVDPWTVLFAHARAEHVDEGNDLVPYWVYDEGENPVRVQRCVPIIPLSKEEDQYERLKDSLVLYRLAFGQPRQEDLIAWLSKANGTKAGLDALASWQLDLRPPKVTKELT